MNLKEYTINYLDMNPDILTTEFILNYISRYIDEHNLFSYINKIVFSDKCSYNRKTKELNINPSFTTNIEHKKFITKKNKNKLNNLIFLFMLNHELTHVLQSKIEKEKQDIDIFFKKELIKSEIIAGKDVHFLNSKNYERYHDFFLFESHANMNAIIEVNNILKELNDKYPKEIYNMYASKIITIPYHEDIYPIKISNRIYNKIIKNLKEINNNEFEHLKYEKLDEKNIPAYDLKKLIIYGYPIPNEIYKYFTDIKQGKRKVKTLF